MMKLEVYGYGVGGNEIMKLGIIGFGNMAEAILGGILESGFVNRRMSLHPEKTMPCLQRRQTNTGLEYRKIIV